MLKTSSDSVANMRGMLDFYGRHNIVRDVALIPNTEGRRSFERDVQSAARFRLAIDFASLKISLQGVIFTQWEPGIE